MTTDRPPDIEREIRRLALVERRIAQRRRSPLDLQGNDDEPAEPVPGLGVPRVVARLH